MAGTLEFSWKEVVTINGRRMHEPDEGPMRPVKPIAIAGTWRYHETFMLPKIYAAGLPQPDPVLLWEWHQNQPTFTSLRFQIRGLIDGELEGYAKLSWWVDKPTSSTNYEPLNTHTACNHMELSCFKPAEFNTDEATIFPNAMRGTAYNRDARGFPELLTNTNAERGRIYAFWASNTSELADLYIDMWGID